MQSLSSAQSERLTAVDVMIAAYAFIKSQLLQKRTHFFETNICIRSSTQDLIENPLPHNFIITTPSADFPSRNETITGKPLSSQR